MHFSRLLLVISFSLFSISLTAQQTNNGSAPSVVSKDPQAVAVLNKVLSLAGGIQAVGAVSDYTATGSVTYHSTQEDVTGTVTLRGYGPSAFRMDSNLPSGVRTEAVSDSSTIRSETGLSRNYNAPLIPSRISLPTLPLPIALTSPGLSLTYKGLANVDGKPSHDIEIQHNLPTSVKDPDGYYRTFHTVEYFIDASTFQILMTKDVVGKGAVRQISYSSYRSINGILVPFSISEQLDGIQDWQIMIDQISFNSGLQDSDFQL